MNSEDHYSRTGLVSAAKAFLATMGAIWVVGAPALAGMLMIITRGKERFSTNLINSFKDIPSWAISLGVSTVAGVQAYKSDKPQAAETQCSQHPQRLDGTANFSDKIIAERGQRSDIQR